MLPLTRGRTALVLLGLLLVPATSAAQRPAGAGGSPKPIAVPGDGTEVFRGLLDYAKIKPITEQELLAGQTRFDDVILISLGDTKGVLLRRAGLPPLYHLQRIIDNGGAVLIATDTRLPVQFTNESLEITGNRVECHRVNAIHDGRESCPYVVPSLVANDDLDSLFRGLDRVATNFPSYITDFEQNDSVLRRIAEFPRNCIVDRREPLPPNAAFAVGAEGPINGNRYQLLAMADHSIFINQMLLEPGTNNLELAYRVIQYLQGPGQTRTRCLFYENGELKDRFDDLRQSFGQQKPMPLPQVNLLGMQDKLTDLGNAIVDRLETNDAHNKLFFGSRDPAIQDRTLAAIMRFFLVMAAIYALWFVIRRAWSSRKPSDIPPAPTVAGAPTGPPGVFDRRQKELLRRNNVYEPIRDLVREFFESLGIHGEQGPRLPKIVVADVVRKPDSLRTAVRDLWRIAYGPPQVLTVSRWRELEPYFVRVRQAHADGKWRFVLAEAVP